MMLDLIEQYRRRPSRENAQGLRDYFERNPSRIWVLRSEYLDVLAAAGVKAVTVEAIEHGQLRASLPH